jgi:tRNA(His) guanylyltransferase
MSDLGDRMKRYEAVSVTRLVPKLPVLIRLDGKAFHSLTRDMLKPWDRGFQECMWQTARYLCEEISGCRVAYVQSDEITLLLVDYQSIGTQGWFDYEVQKLVSVSASMAAAAFARTYSVDALAAFDARAWNLPAHEVVNCFIWRQQDATRNSILGLAQAHHSHKELQGRKTDALQDMLMVKGINWNDCPIPQKRGVCIVRETFEIPPRETFGVGEYAPVIRHRWAVDEAIPIFTEDRDYIERFVR